MSSKEGVPEEQVRCDQQVRSWGWQSEGNLWPLAQVRPLGGQG